MFNRRKIIILIVALALALAGCKGGEEAAEASAPSVQITSPTVGAEVTVGEEVIVQATASDTGGPGVAMVDLYVGDADAPVMRDEVPGDPVETYNASLAWTPTTAGSVTLRVVAYRADNVPSPEASVTLSVVEPPATPTPEPSPTPAAQPPYTFKAIQETNVYCGPGETYPVMGVLEADEEIEVEAIDPTGDWYQIEYMESIGWVHKDYVEPVDELGELPESTEEAACVTGEGQAGGAAGGAAGAGVPCVPPTCVPVNFCGDGFCLAPVENALLCPVDCVTGAGAVCGDMTCDASEDPVSCPFDCGGAAAVCGDGTCDLGENNTNCPADCPANCGNLACEAGEDANNCPIDCGLGTCGDGTCDFFENPANCPADCAVVFSDRALKENFSPVDRRAVLDALGEVPVTTWNYIQEGADVRHMGPMAQDFYAAFELGEDDTRINLLDASGVTIAAIQALYGVAQEQDAQIADQQEQIAALDARLAALEEQAGQNNALTWPPPFGLLTVGLLCGGSLLLGLVLGRRWPRDDRR